MENADVAGFDEGPLHSNVYMLQMASASESDYSDEESESESERHPPNQANVGVRMLSHMNIGKVEETADDFGGFEAGLHGFVGNNHNQGEWKDAYDRKLPGNYEDHDDH